MADRIAHRRGREMLWMGAVEPDAADLIVLVIEDRNVILPLQHLQSQLHGKREWRRVGLALVRRIGMGVTRARHLAQLLDGLGCTGPQNGVGVIPRLDGSVCRTVGETFNVCHRFGAARQRLEIERVTSPKPREVGDRCGAGRRNCHRREHAQRGGADQESFHAGAHYARRCASVVRGIPPAISASPDRR